ncbi:hypothetical protein, partial [Pseudomonas viridiflava]|uniref:hypothetical protein n=1 Tax=Pseudomonas viridiflava TaxID=33069 RepID=UPI00197D23EA
KLLDLMDEEHAPILNGMACDKQGEANHRVSLSLPPTAESKLKNERALKLQLQVEASSVDDLRMLMETAFSELRLRVEARDLTSSRLKGSYYGSMSGTLGACNFDLNLNGGL